MSEQKYNITEILIKEVSQNLCLNQLDILRDLINKTISALDSGDSCYKIESTQLCTDNEAIGILSKSGICNIVDKLGDIDTSKLAVALTLIDSTKQLYLSRYYHYEVSILAKINILNNSTKTNYKISDNLHNSHAISDLPNKEQLNAIINCSNSKFNIITGGPGTGKTTTIALLIDELVLQYGEQLKIRLAAPTGKAAIRMQQSIQKTTIANGNISKPLITQINYFATLLDNSENFTTIHRLLGTQRNSIYFKHNAENMLDFDVLIVDEASMISLPLFYKLFEAINVKSIKHIILIGDRNQLSSVEEGSVFQALTQNKDNIFINNLVASNRNKGTVAKLANAVISNQIELSLELLQSNSDVYFCNKIDLIYENLFSTNAPSYDKYLQLLIQNKTTAYDIFANILDDFIILCNSNNGIYGTHKINQYIDNYIKSQLKNYDEWYNGRPIIILENQNSLGIANGDIGIYLTNENLGKAIYFANGVILSISALPKYSLAYAITIHKSQGSEYSNVAVILANIENLLTQQLFYTAITRAKQHVSIYGTETNISQSINNKTIRQSGLNFAFAT